MEFPDLGKHCSVSTCQRLDFLPVKCDACSEILCSEHYSYEKHGCKSGQRKDVQVPVCPLCGEPVPTPSDVSPDLTVGRHIDQFCRSEKKRIFTNMCSFAGCRQKELVPILCGDCKKNYCIRHRHFNDHRCQGKAREPQASRKGIFGSAPKAPVRATATSGHAQLVQGNMTEDEALAHAIALSMQEQEHRQPPTVAVGGAQSNSSSKDKCSLS
ncbi:AN1-type zinc finger protein 2A [Lutzomyia longipalpis]|uniref:AN1-type domain-containing protein n=1 Tax=Lutzomyia longipalpis TaxID=7200 RepID=A0A1B0CW47_LUTLO|nr:AN1-type zinc finger protein 2A [Lutzomyia longipalpis]